MKKISIIVPIYNVEKYLDICLNSLVNQTLKDIEIVLINDGSTDSSYEIAVSYEKKYKNVTLYNQLNHGLSYTRNVGLEHAHGKYIMFIDSDDYLETDACEKLYDYACKMDADIVTFDLKYVYKDSTTSFMYGGKKEGKVDTHEYMIGASSAASKMYKKEFLSRINFKFKEGIWSEDIAIIPLLCIYTDKIFYLNRVSYNYVQHSNSITNQTSYNKKTLDAVKSLEIFESIVKENNKYDEYKSEIEFIYITNLLLTLPLKVYKYKEGKKDIKKMSKIMKEKYPHFRKNKYYILELSRKQKIYINLFYYKLPGVVNCLYLLKSKIIHK